MAHCYICDKELSDDFKVGPDLKPEPCSECCEAADEALAEMDEEHQHNTVTGFGEWSVPEFMRNEKD